MLSCGTSLFTVPISWASPACPILPLDRKQSSPDNSFLLLFLLVFHLCLTLNCFDLHENIGEIKEKEVHGVTADRTPQPGLA